MKRILFVFIALFVFLLFSSCDTPINKYQAKNDDEKKIVVSLNEYADARNGKDVNRLQSTFHDKGMYYAGSGGTFTKNQVATSDPTFWTSYGSVQLYSPDIKIDGNEANLILPLKFGPAAKVQGLYKLFKEDDRWLIMEAKH